MVAAGIRSQGSGLGWGSRWGRAESGCSHCPVADLIQSLSRASSEKARAGWSLCSLSQEELKLLDCTEKLPQSSKGRKEALCSRLFRRGYLKTSVRAIIWSLCGGRRK